MMEFEVRHWMSNHEARHRRAGRRQEDPEHYRQPLLRFQRLPGHRRLSDLQDLARQGARAGSDAHEAGSNHFDNFLNAVRSRKRSDLNAEIEEGAISTTLIHLANISYRVGRTLHFDAASYECKGDAEANAMFTRDYRKPFVVPKLA